MKSAGRLFVLLIIKVFTVSVLSASVSMPGIFSDNMVLQQNSQVRFWGWAKTFEKVTLSASWLKEPLSATAGTQGTWEINVATPAAGGPYDIEVKGSNVLTFHNVLIGEVWLCSGQSNMEWSAGSGIVNAEEEIKNAVNPDIRLFTVSTATSLFPQEHLAGNWSECTPETMKSFSAIGYFFARKISAELGVPVGVINSSWGGTPAEAWMPEEAITGDPFLAKAAALQTPVPWGPVETARIYNAMIAPLVPYRIAGVLWYQGEANTVNGYAYKELLSALIQSWRGQWSYDFPFYFAQIAPYKYGKPFEGVIVRDAQRRTLVLPNTGMVLLSDIGDTTDIHPKNKQAAALRFANLALSRTYGKNFEDSGPLFRELYIDKNKAIVKFDHAEGLHATGENICCFEIAGSDMVYYPAEAKIKDDNVIVQSEMVKAPVSVRFAWGNVSTPNLFNGAGLPASCFITP